MMNKQIIGVVDYKVGNLKSIFRTLNNAKANYKMVNNFKKILKGVISLYCQG